MRSVTFTIAANVSAEKQQELLGRVRTWDGVKSAGTIAPAMAGDDEVRRMCFAYLDDQTPADAVVRRLNALPEVAAAEVPAERGLSF